MLKRRTQSGFTLVEIVVVVTMIAFLSSIVLASVNTARIKSKNTRYVADLKILQTAFTQYILDGHDIPTCNGVVGCSESDANFGGGPSALDTLLAPLVVGGYIDEIPHYPGGGYGGFVTIAKSVYSPVTGPNEYACSLANEDWDPGGRAHVGILMIINLTNFPYDLPGEVTHCFLTFRGGTGVEDNCRTYPNEGYLYCLEFIN